MHDYQVSAEVVRVTLIVGVLLSMMVYERLQLTTGGAIVPAYLALAASRPPAIVATLLIGWLTYLVVHKLIARKHILYGRRKFEIEVLVGVGLTLVSALIARWAGQLDPMLLALSAIGFLVPGILAHDMARQKPGRTLLTTVATGGLLVVFLTTYESLLDLVPGTGQTGISLSSVHGFPSELLLPAVAGSVLVGMFVFAKLQLRSGGFVTGAYLAYVAPRWYDLLFTVVVAVIVWYVVVHVLMPRLPVFGRRKLSTMLLVSSIIAWGGEILLVELSNGDYVPWRGLTVATLLVPALLANDAQRQGWAKTATGATLSATGVLTLVSLGAAVGHQMGWL